MKLFTLLVVISYTMFNANALYAQQASSLPVELQIGQAAPFTGYLLSLDLGKDMMTKAQLALKVPILEQLNSTNEGIIAQQKIQIDSLKEDKKQLLDSNSKIQQDYASANKYNGVIYGSFFIGGVLFTILTVLALGYAIQKTSSVKASIVTSPLKF